jgi:hypothetical protein
VDWWSYILVLLDQFDADSDIDIVILIVLALISVLVVGALAGLAVRLYKAAR